MLEELGRTPPTFGGKRDEVVQVLGGVMQAEELEGVSERGHRASPLMVLPFEWIEAGKPYREFLIPAARLNGHATVTRLE